MRSAWSVYARIFWLVDRDMGGGTGKGEGRSGEEGGVSTFWHRDVGVCIVPRDELGKVVDAGVGEVGDEVGEDGGKFVDCVG